MNSTIYDTIGNSHPKLTRGFVWCTTCGRKLKVRAAECFRFGWPTCCGYTMTIDSPEERAAIAKAQKGHP